MRTYSKSRATRSDKNVSNQALPKFLGLFSLAIGATALMAPRWLARQTGITRRSVPTLRSFGMREVISGITVLSPRTRRFGLVSRIVGNLLDIGLLGANFRRPASNERKLSVASAAALGFTALDVIALQGTKNGAIASVGEPIAVRESVAINRSPEVLYNYWRNLKNLPRLLSFIRSVEEFDDRRSLWTAKIPGNIPLRWEAEITTDRPGEQISWRSVEGSDLQHSGSVRFHVLPGGHGTAVMVEIRSSAGGLLKHRGPIAKFLSSISEMKIRKDLRRFKQLMETGEIATTQGQPAGRPQPTWIDEAARI